LADMLMSAFALSLIPADAYNDRSQ
jgi:hypothetical protein